MDMIFPRGATLNGTRQGALINAGLPGALPAIKIACWARRSAQPGFHVSQTTVSPPSTTRIWQVM
jgi:hypothetical protein